MDGDYKSCNHITTFLKKIYFPSFLHLKEISFLSHPVYVTQQSTYGNNIAIFTFIAD